MRRLSIHLVDHCNLGCASCSHFCPLANIKKKSHILKPDEFERDMRRMADVVGNIGYIELYGGEPLLHPGVPAIMFIARKYFPESRIVLITNGILLKDQADDFWKSAHENRIEILPTKYPIDVDWDAAINKAEEFAVDFRFFNDDGTGDTEDICKSMYFKPLDLAGNQNVYESFQNCWHGGGGCTQLYKGRIYMCPVAAYSEFFNDAFGENLELSDADSLDIYADDFTANKIAEFVSTPIPFCKYCDTGKTSNDHKWTSTKHDIGEWVLRDDEKIKKYNIATGASESVAWMLELFLHSLHENADMSKIDKIFVGDFGLSPLSLAKAKSYQRVEIIKGSASRQSTFAQDDGWNDAVNQKLNLARDAINLSGGTPVVFSDCDTIVVHDFSENLHLKCDVGLCRRRAPKFYTYGGEVPERSDFITSFILFNDPIKSKRFIAKIQNKMQELRDSGAPSPWETRACNHIIYKDEIEDINICSFREIIISAENCYVPGTTKIIHYKTNPMAGGRGFQRLMPSMVFAHAIIMKNMPFWLGRRFIKFLKTGQE